MKRTILTTVLVLLAVLAGFAQTDALVVELNNGLADIYQVSANLRIVNQTDKDSIAVVEGTKGLASYASAEVKRIAFDEETILTDSVERAALKAIYYAMGGDNWKNNLNWFSEKRLWNWYGVGIDVSNGHVLRLFFRKNNLKGEIPPELCNLKYLTNLDLSYNNLTGEIPESLGNLPNLTYLDLSANKLTGGIPSSLGSLTNLGILNFSGNQLTGEIPLSLNNLTNLSSLILSSNQLTGEIPSSLGNLTNLTVLDFRANKLTGEIPSSLGNLTNLGFLDFSANKLTGEIPLSLNNLTNLSSLILSSNQLTGEIPSSLGNLTNLTVLDFRANKLTGEIPLSLNNLTNLSSLILSSNQLTGEIPSSLGNLTNLTVLDFRANKLTGEIPSSLGKLTNLINLMLNGNQLTGNIPHELGNLINLRTLDLSANYLTGEIPAELGNLTNLVYLLLEGNELAGNIPAEIGNLRNLDHLYLYRNHLSGNIPPELGNMTNLKRMFLNNNQLSGEIPESFNNLTNLVKKNTDGTTSFWLNSYYNNLSGKVPSLFSNSVAWRDRWIDIIGYNRNYNLDEVIIPAPSFSVRDIDDNILNSNEIYPNNKYTAIFHWATWCPYSNAVMPVIIQLYDKYRDKGLEVIGLIYDETEKTIRDFIAKKGIKWRNFISTKDNQMDFRTPSGYPDGEVTPQITLVDSDGRVRFSDVINNRSDLANFVESKLGTGDDVEIYKSTDFSADGKLAILQTASTSKDIKVVIMGDGFSDRMVADGSYDIVMNKAKEALFSIEPVKSYQDLFTVISVTTVSENEVFSDTTHTALQCYNNKDGIGGNHAKVFEYAKAAIGKDAMDDAIIIVVLNSELSIANTIGGICYMYQPEHPNTWGSGASIAYLPNISGSGGITNPTSFETILCHEAIGHGFAKLGDEYVMHNETIPVEEKEHRRANEQYGWWKNVDFTSNPQDVKWSSFITDNRYSNEAIGVYEGGLTYQSGVWRPTEKSIMSSGDTEFNAPSRQAIWYRINKLTQGESWEGTREDFVAFDKARASARASARAKANNKGLPKPIRLAPPVVKKITWRMEK